MRNQGLPFVYKGKEVLVDEYALEVLDFDLTTTSYFNSGVLVMDLDLWRQLDISERCIKFCRDAGELNTADQDAANHVLQGNFLRLDPRWNSFSYLYREYFPAPDQNLPDIFGGFQKNLGPPICEWLEVLTAWAFDPWIVHFAFRSKPWCPDHRRTDYDSEFWEHAFKTPYGNRLYQEFLSAQTAVP
jgi:lipopolysaccharide biosynthesis glycosyltransferase